MVLDEVEREREREQNDADADDEGGEFFLLVVVRAPPCAPLLRERAALYLWHVRSLIRDAEAKEEEVEEREKANPQRSKVFLLPPQHLKKKKSKPHHHHHQLFVSSGLQSQSLVKEPSLSDDMGLFLQKTNIIRDYLEDICEEPAPRMFWPAEIWGRYAASLDEFKEREAAPAALACLNHMVADAMRHALPALTYMERVTDPRVFRFCAIPQLMAAATLSLCYDNHGVFEGVVKMRRGETAIVLLRTRSMEDVYLGFARFARQIAEKAKKISSSSNSSRSSGGGGSQQRRQRDPTASLAIERAQEIEAACARGLGLKPGQPIPGLDGRLVEAGGVLTPVHAAVLIAVAALAVRAAASHPGGIAAFLASSSSTKWIGLFGGLAESPSMVGAWLATGVVLATIAAAVAPRLLSFGA